LKEFPKILLDNFYHSVDLRFGSKINSKRIWNLFVELSKLKITGFVALSAAFGYIIYYKSLTFELFIIAVGVFFLAVGSASLNHVQEWKYDAKMLRTKGRPIPSGNITLVNAILFSLTFTIIGLMIIFFYSNLTTVILGVLTLIWYNFIYTPLKRISAISIFPGAIIGALPPMIGYSAAGGNPTDIEIVIVGLFLFLWQAPHFWLLLLIYEEDFKRAGFPSLTDSFTRREVRMFTLIGILALLLSSFLLPIFTSAELLISGSIVLLSGFWLWFKMSKYLQNDSQISDFRKAFMNLNIYVLIIVFFISIEQLII
jgi:protoheme IX farnesyltransferase